MSGHGGFPPLITQRGVIILSPPRWRHYLSLIRLTNRHRIERFSRLFGLLHYGSGHLCDRKPVKVCLVHCPPVFFEPSEIVSDRLPQIVDSYLLLTLFPHSFNGRTRFLMVFRLHGRGSTASEERILLCVLGLEFLDAGEHEVFAVFDKGFGFCLVGVVVGGDQVGDSHVVLRKVRFFQDVVEEFLVPLGSEGVSEGSNRVHCVSGTQLYHMILRYTQLFIIIRRTYRAWKLCVAFKIEIFRAVYPLERRSQTLRQLDTPEIDRKPLLQLRPPIVIVLACEVGVEGADHVSMGIRPVLRAPVLVNEVTSVGREIVPISSHKG